MIKLVVTDRGAAEHQLNGTAGATLMEILRDQGLDVAAICGGQAACGTCHCLVAPAWQGQLPAKQGEEQELLASLAHYDPQSSRLACQIELTEAMDGLTLALAPEE